MESTDALYFRRHETEPRHIALWLILVRGISLSDKDLPLPLEERVAACRARAKELAVLAEQASVPEAARDLRDLARRWLALADRLEAREGP